MGEFMQEISLFLSGPLHYPFVPEFPSCLHSSSPSPPLPYPTHGSLCLLPGSGALFWLQLFRYADADPVWDRWSLLPHVDLPSSNSCTEVSHWRVNWMLYESSITLHVCLYLFHVCEQLAEVVHSSYMIVMWYRLQGRKGEIIGVTPVSLVPLF